MTKNNRLVIESAEERRRIQWEYFPWNNLDIGPDREKPFRAEIGVALLPGGNVMASLDSHAEEARRSSEQARFSFWLMRQGAAQTISADRRSLTAKPGECLVIRHFEGQKTSYSGGRRSILTLEEGAIRDFVRRHYQLDAPADMQFGEVFRFEQTPLCDLVPIIDTIINSRVFAQASTDPVQNQLQDALIAYVVENAPHNFKALLQKAEHPPLPLHARRARDFIHANVESPITLGDIAAAARCGPRQLQLTFKDCFGTSPTAMLRKLRLELAAARLSAGDHQSVTDVAFSLGYSNLGRFASEFRRQFGCLPSDLVRFGSRRPDSH